jgi:peroxiredoxin
MSLSIKFLQAAGYLFSLLKADRQVAGGALKKHLSFFLVFLFLTTEAFTPFAADELVGKKAPGFTLKDLDNREVSLASLKGKVVLINFWATWCPPCKAEMPSLNMLYSEYKDRGFMVLAISMDRKEQEVIEYLKKNTFSFKVLLDPKMNATRYYGVFSLPTSFLIDRNGVIVKRYLGEERWNSSSIKNDIQKLL